MKKRIFTLVLCCTLIVSSMGVFAGSNYKEFGQGSERGGAYVSANGGLIEASTTPLVTMVSIFTYVHALGRYSDGEWAYGESYAYTYPSAADVCIGAESHHGVNGVSTYLTCSYN